MLESRRISLKNIFKITFTAVLLLTFFAVANAQQAGSYEEAISKADQLYKQKSYLDAKGYYQIALKLRPDDEYSKERISLVVEQLKGQKAKEEEYYQIIDLADVYYDENAFDKAIQQYNKALLVIPGDEYANGKIKEINRLRREEKDRIEAYDAEMALGNNLLAENKFEEAIYHYSDALSYFPAKQQPREQIKLAEQLKAEYENNKYIFDAEVEEAERYLLIKDYATALVHYEKAQSIFPDNKELANKIKKIKPEAESQKKYNDVVQAADELYINKDLFNARVKYSEAQKIRPEDSYPKDMILKIEEQLALQRKDVDKSYKNAITSADSLFNLEEYNPAKGAYSMALVFKPGETYPASKIKEIDKLIENQRKAFEADYNNKIKKADELYSAAQYQQAKELYEMALTIKPEDEYPKQKLADIEKQLILLAEQEKLDNQYQDLIAEGDRLFDNQQYDLAKKKYAEAQAIKSMEDYPQQRIDEISTLLLQASQQKELEEKYSNQIILATRLLNEDKLDEATDAYANALQLKPNETLPKEQIAKIEQIKADRLRQKEIEKEYKAYLASGDSLQVLFLYDDAIAQFQLAQDLMPGDEVAAQRLLKARQQKSNYEKEQMLKQNYAEAIKNGDENLKEENYELALSEFKKASGLKPNEVYPKNKIAQVESILQKMEAEKEQRYTDAVAKANNFFDQQNYQEAVIQYKIASSIKPEDQFAAKRVAECNTLLAEKQLKIKNEYDIAIADADKLYAVKIYDKAIQAYQDAEVIKPDETYPREMIRKITKLIEDNAIVDVIKQTVIIKSGNEETFKFEPVKISVRKTNYVLIKARSLDGKSFKLIFNYGAGGSKNGGFVLQVPEGEDFNDFIVRVGNQYKWFSEDNNWISIYPENGDIEISLVRISTSD
ncbi:MAG TPA: hypothetical protein VIN10_12990 [Bacteroidales bacterium]